MIRKEKRWADICHCGNGRPKRTFVSGRETFHAKPVRRIWLFLDITITDDGREKRLVGTFYDNDDGSIVDQFTLIKEEN
jgi:hypothetical protein